MSEQAKNTAKIDFINARGEGAFKADGNRFSVPYVLPEEDIEWTLDEQNRRAVLSKVIKPSENRISAPCVHFGECGGCLMQHWRAEEYRNWKKELIFHALKKVGLETQINALRDAKGDGRRRAIFHARRSHDGKWNVGFASYKSHSIVPLQDCMVLSPALRNALPVVRALANPLSNFSHGIDIQVTAADTGLDVDIRGLGDGAKNVAADLARLAERLDLARLSIHGEPVSIRRPVIMRVGTLRLELPPASFLQATKLGEEILSTLVLEYVGQAAWVTDLFAGVGPFTLRMLPKIKVHAVEGSAKAIEALSKTANLESGLKTFTSEVRDLVKRPLMPEELARYDAIVFDPPRSGAMEQVRMIAASGVPTVVAVSCNAESFAKDAKTLVDAGYTLKQVTPVDQFIYSSHIELVAQFTRTKAKPQSVAPRGLRIERGPKRAPQKRFEKQRPQRNDRQERSEPTQKEPTQFVKVGGMRIALPPSQSETAEPKRSFDPKRPNHKRRPNPNRPQGPKGGKR